MKKVAPHGEWTSPVTAAMLTQASVGLGLVGLDGEHVAWTELRPSEAGRTALCEARLDGSARRELSPWMNVRSTVHEYGGGAALARAGVRLAVSYADQRVWRLDGPPDGLPLVAESGGRLADMDVDPAGRRVAAVRERPRAAGEAQDAIVLFPLDGDGVEPIVVDGAHDFCACPRFSPDGRSLAYLTWDHPDMPWDGSELWLVAVDGGVPGPPRRVAGGRGEAICQPSFSPGGRLTFVSDRSGFWNLYQLAQSGEPRPLAPAALEFGRPMWTLGQCTYGFVDEGHILACATDRARDRLLLIDLARGGAAVEVPSGCVAIDALHVRGERVALVGGASDQPAALIVLDLASGARTEIARSLSVPLESDDISRPESIEFPTPRGATAHAFFYPPCNRELEGPAGVPPPLLVMCHGGPTAAASPALRLQVQFWTTRGLAVVDVNYGGSSGFGRAYRERLDGRWGEVDLEDCCAAVRHLVARGRVDGGRVAIRGGSAGGYTALCAATFSDLFSAAASHYGIADLELLARDTHKFESRYFDRLVGKLPEASAVYRARSPIHHVDRIRTPLILLQGLDDKVVPPQQAELMAAALDRRGVTHAYLAFAGESHGFRRAESIVRAFAAELAFFGHVLGFTPHSPPPPPDFEIKHPLR